MLERIVDLHDVRLVHTAGDNIYASGRALLWTKDSSHDRRGPENPVIRNSRRAA
ncbi:MAG: hypothetical protein ABJC89_03850 [Acidobacteriota bacterium]